VVNRQRQQHLCTPLHHFHAGVQAIEGGEWRLEPSRLPDAFMWPTWGALRERILQPCKIISTEHAATVRDAFAAEVVKLSPPQLSTWSVRRLGQEAASLACLDCLTAAS
jgi:hypothetical protein